MKIKQKKKKSIRSDPNQEHEIGTNPILSRNYFTFLKSLYRNFKALNFNILLYDPVARSLYDEVQNKGFKALRSFAFDVLRDFPEIKTKFIEIIEEKGNQELEDLKKELEE